MTKLSDYDNAPLEIREQFSPSPDMIKRTQFEGTKRDLRYQVGRVDIPVFAATGNAIIEFPVSQAIYFYILSVGAGLCLMALDSGDFIGIQLGDKIRCSPVEKLRFKRNSGAGTYTLMFIYSNDPLFDYENGGDFTSRGSWNPAGGI